MDMPARLWTSTTVSMHHTWQQSVDLRSEPWSDNLKTICFRFKTFACKVRMHEIRNHQVQHREYSLGSAMNQHLWQPWFSRWFFSRKLVHGVHGSNPQSAFERSLNVSAMFLSTQFLQWMATEMRKWQEFFSCADYTILTNGRQSKRQWADSPYPFRLLILAYHLTATQVANHKSCNDPTTDVAAKPYRLPGNGPCSKLPRLCRCFQLLFQHTRPQNNAEWASSTWQWHPHVSLNFSVFFVWMNFENLSIASSRIPTFFESSLPLPCCYLHKC